MEMGTWSWEWEGMGSKKSFLHISTIYIKNKNAGSGIVTMVLMESFYFPLMMYTVEAVPMQTSPISLLNNCVNLALRKISDLVLNVKNN